MRERENRKEGMTALNLDMEDSVDDEATRNAILCILAVIIIKVNLFHLKQMSVSYL